MSQINLAELNKLLNIKHQEIIDGIGDYKSIKLVIVNGYLNRDSAVDLQKILITNPHY